MPKQNGGAGRQGPDCKACRHLIQLSIVQVNGLTTGRTVSRHSLTFLLFLQIPVKGCIMRPIGGESGAWKRTEVLGSNLNTDEDSELLYVSLRRQEDRRCGASSHATARGRADCILSSSAHQTKGGHLFRRRWTGEGHTLFSPCRHGDDRPGLLQTLAKNKLS
ncbi:hypothetical protein MHYP_G00343190 [Metynnis hypsauchen]